MSRKEIESAVDHLSEGQLKEGVYKIDTVGLRPDVRNLLLWDLKRLEVPFGDEGDWIKMWLQAAALSKTHEVLTLLRRYELDVETIG